MISWFDNYRQMNLWILNYIALNITGNKVNKHFIGIFNSWIALERHHIKCRKNKNDFTVLFMQGPMSARQVHHCRPASVFVQAGNCDWLVTRSPVPSDTRRTASSGGSLTGYA